MQSNQITVKQAILTTLARTKRKTHLKELYREVDRLRPGTPPHSVRGRLNEGIVAPNGDVRRHGEGYYSLELGIPDHNLWLVRCLDNLADQVMSREHGHFGATWR